MGRDQCHTWFKAGEIKEGEEGKGGGRQHGIMQKKMQDCDRNRGREGFMEGMRAEGRE